MTTFLSPLAFLLGLLLPAVVVLYLLRLRRTEVLVSSTFLWRKSLEDLHANAPFQRLVKNLLMIAQLLTLAVLVFALARPVLSGSLVSGRTLAILIDTSASMQATDVAPSRLEAARAEALKIIEGMTGRDQTMLLSFDAKPRILASLTQEKAELREALSGLKPSDAGSSVREALIIASSVLRSRRPATILILSDGRCHGLDVALPDAVEVRYLPIGERGRNAGITALDLRPFEQDPSRQQLFVETRGVGDLPKATLSLYVNGGLVDARKVSWEGRKPVPAVFEIRGEPEARIRLALDVSDDLAADNEAFAVLPDRPRRRILLVTEKNYFLERLLNLEHGVELFTITPQDYAARLAAEGPGDYALTVLDRWVPERLNHGSYLVFGAVPPIEGFKALGTVQNPVVLDWKRAHPLMRFANFSNLRVGKAIRWECPPWSQSLLDSSEGPLLVLAQRGRLTVAAVGFDLVDTDWPFRLSFPIFVSNAIRTLGGEGLGASRLLRPGDAVTWRTDAKPLPPVLGVTLPGGGKEEVPFHGDEIAGFAATSRVGFYEFSDGRETRAYGVSLRSAEESDVTPVAQKDLTLSGGRVASSGQALEQREFWPWLAVAALGLLCLEWAMYHRRWI